MVRLNTLIQKAAKPVQVSQMSAKEGEEKPLARDYVQQPLPPSTSEPTGEVLPEHGIGRDTDKFATIEVTSSKGKKYRVVVPESYADHIPRTWEWDKRKLLVAESIAMGIPITQIVNDPQVGVKSRMTIYSWLEHPEFKEHVDALVTETGFAAQRERIAGMSRLTQKLFDKLINELSSVKLTDKSVGAIITGFQNGLKHLAQEKGEFIEQQNVVQQTSIEGKLAVATVQVEEVLKAKTEEERQALRQEFNQIGDDIIRHLTGGKE